MSSSTGIFAIILSAVLTNNFIFSQFLGCCPFLGCSSKIDTAAGTRVPRSLFVPSTDE